MTKVVLFANGIVGYKVFKYILKSSDDVSLLVLNNKEDQRCGERLINLANKKCIQYLTFENLNVQKIEYLKPNIGISAYFGNILKADIINCFPQGIINLHPSYLPYNQGRNTNVWPLIDNSPAGVTIHKIDTGVDTGLILIQKIVEIYQTDTAKTLYKRLEKEMFKLFALNWNRLKNEKIKLVQQPKKGTKHLGHELSKLKILDLEEKMTMREAINRLRACTFSPFPGATFNIEKKSYEIEIKIREVKK